MVDQINENEEMSLAALADVDVSDIAEVRFEQLPAGLYNFEVTEAELLETTRDDETIYYASFDLKVVECVSAMEGDDPESLEGKVHKHRQNIDPNLTDADVATAIGRVRAFVSDVGGDSKGKLGTIVAETKGLMFPAKIVKTKSKSDPDVEYSNLRFTKK